MQGRDEISIVITFFFGLATGFYFYLTGFSALEQTMIALFAPNTSQNYFIEAYQYGGCERTRSCASFIIRADGSYSYLVTSIGTGGKVQTGLLTNSQMRSVRTLVNDGFFIDLPISTKTCTSWSDGIDIRYEITVGQTQYGIDTCTSVLTLEQQRTLSQIWDWF